MKTTFTFILIFFQSIVFQSFGQLNYTTVSIPMRDGKTLAADYYLPSDTGSYPVVLVQTPYNKNFYRDVGLPLGVRFNQESSNYAFVILDWRGFYGSASAFSVTGDKGEDGYDAIEWIIDQPWSNGKVGTWGPSALSNVQFETAYEQHPNHLCAIPEVTMPQTRYDKYYPGGVLEVASLQTLGVLFGSNTFNLVLDNPHYNNTWNYVENSSLELDKIDIPMLIVGGWYDHNIDFDLKLLDWMSQQTDISVRDKHKILIGPWVHGGVGLAHVGSEMQGELSYPNASGFQVTYENMFLDFYLRGAETGWESKQAITFYQMGEEVWKYQDDFGNKNDTVVFVFKEDASLTTNTETDEVIAMSLSYNPTDPSPTIGGKTLHPDLDQGPYSQAGVLDRGDNLYFETEIFTEALVVEGRIQMKVAIKAGSKDTDLALRLIDVYPDGRKMLLDDDIHRMRFRNGFTTNDTSFMQLNETYEVNMEFDPLAITFMPGHRLGVIITNSNYPRYNRNMNTGDEMYPDGKMDTLVNPLTITTEVLVGDLSVTSMQIPGYFMNTDKITPTKSVGFKVFPNPASDLVQVQGLANQQSVVLYNTKGQIMKADMLMKGSEMQIDVSTLHSGLYVLRIDKEVYRFVKQ